LIWQQLKNGLVGNVEFTFTEFWERFTVGPVGEILLTTVTVPANPLMLVTFSNSEVSDETLGTVRDKTPGAVWRSKYGWFVNLAVCAVSDSAVVVPLEIVTQTPPATLLLAHPVWNPIGLLADVPVML
jgi:hypothetical protein